jgi:hypothetical protein
MSIADNKKAFHDYFIEEQFEAGVVLQGWEVKAIRAGRLQLKEAYVIVRNGEIFSVWGTHWCTANRLNTHTSRLGAYTQIIAEQSRDQQTHRQSRTFWLYDGAAQHALQQWQNQMSDRACQR